MTSAKGPFTRDHVENGINELFRRAAKGDPARWMRGLLTFIVNMRRYSIFNAKLIYAQKPGAVAVGTPTYWAKKGRTVRPGAMPIVILVPKGPFTFVYEYEDTEGPEPKQRPSVTSSAPATIADNEWTKLIGAVERDGRYETGDDGYFRVVEEGLGQALHGDVHHRQDERGRFVIRINRNPAAAEKWATLIHELAHVYCGHCGPHDRGWWPDRRRLPDLFPESQTNIQEFEAEAVAWIVASRAGIETKSVDYLAGHVASLDIERIDIDAVLRTANHIESIAPTSSLRFFKTDGI